MNNLTEFCAKYGYKLVSKDNAQRVESDSGEMIYHISTRDTIEFAICNTVTREKEWCYGDCVVRTLVNMEKNLSK